MNKILIATKNIHKFEEITRILNLNVDFLNLVQLDTQGIEVEESGDDYSTNAFIKAKVYAEKFLLPTIAEDSGFEIMKLGGLPGIMSARFLNEYNYKRKMEWILKLMKNESDRKARFVCSAVYYDPYEKISITSTGVIEGTLSREIRGTGGFGYDPIFIPQGYDRTFGELPKSVKNRISHRAIAFTKLQKLLSALFYEYR